MRQMLFMHGPIARRSSDPFRRRRSLARWKVAALALTVGLALPAALTRLPRDGEPDDARPPAWVSRTVAAGGIRVVQAPGWSRPARAAEVPGMPFTERVTLVQDGSHLTVVAGTLPATSPSLLPVELRSRLRLPPADPARVRLSHSLSGYHYTGLALLGSTGFLDVYALPTTEGVATIACLAPPSAAWLIDDCLTIAATLDLTAGQPLRLGRDAAFRQRFWSAMTLLDARRSEARRKLARAEVPQMQADLVAGLARRYRRLATSLAPLVPRSPTWPRDTVRTLTRVAGAYERIAAAFTARSGAALDDARREVDEGERRLKRTLRTPSSS
jgi:hypothetical protein